MALAHRDRERRPERRRTRRGGAKWFFLPNAHTDFIFAIIGEELGFIGCLLVLGLFVGLGLVGLRIAQRAPDRFGMLIATGVTAWIVGQAAINLGAVVGMLPVSGVPLPFLSVGGTSLVITMFGVGVVANIAPDGPCSVRGALASSDPPGARPRVVRTRVFALLTGGGTGGHTYPAIAVAQELKRRGHTVRFVGGRRGIEGRVVPAAGFEIDLLPGRGLQRRLTLQNVVAIWGACSAVVRAIAIVRRFRPRVVVGFGGYASFPCVLAARLLRVPVVVHEQDAAPGLANRLGVRLGAARPCHCPARRCRARPSPEIRSAPRSRTWIVSPRATRRSSRSSAARRARARSTAPRWAATTPGETVPISPCITCAGRAISRPARRSSRPPGVPAMRWRTSSSATRSAWISSTPAPRSRCAGPARARSPS